MHFIFMDLDGTIEDSRLDMIESVNAIRTELGWNPLPSQEIQPEVIQGMEHLYRTCFSEMFTDVDDASSDRSALDKIQELYIENYRAHIIHHTRAYTGIREALTSLQEIAVLGIYTNKPEELSRHLLLELELSRNFAFIIGCDTFAESKPSAEPIRRATKDLDFDATKGKIFVIGDSSGDMQAALNAEAISIWCEWGYYQNAPTDPTPDFIAARPADLIDLVRKFDPKNSA